MGFSERWCYSGWSKYLISTPKGMRVETVPPTLDVGVEGGDTKIMPKTTETGIQSEFMGDPYIYAEMG